MRTFRALFNPDLYNIDLVLRREDIASTGFSSFYSKNVAGISVTP